DVIPEDDGAERGSGYNPVRGQRVMDYADDVLNQIIPLKRGRHSQVREYRLFNENGHLVVEAELTDHSVTRLSNEGKFIGYQGDPDAPTLLLFVNHGLHLELHIDRESQIGRQHHAGIKDIVMESAMTTIQDCEDSVAAVDARDKVAVYRNWLGLMKGTLEASLEKNGKTI